MAVDSALQQPQPPTANQRPTFSPQYDVENLQLHSLLPGSGSDGPFCDLSVQSSSTLAIPGPFIFNAREIVLTATREHLERDIKSLGNPEEP